MRAHSKVHANRETAFGDAILRIIPLGNFYFKDVRFRIPSNDSNKSIVYLWYHQENVNGFNFFKVLLYQSSALSSVYKISKFPLKRCKIDCNK